MDKNKLEADFTDFMDQLDVIGKQYILDNNFEPEKLEETCVECGKKFYTFWNYDKCLECRKIDTLIRENKGDA